MSAAMKTDKNQLITLRIRKDSRLDRQLDQRMRKASEVLEKPVSQILREAIKAELDRLARKHPELRRRFRQLAEAKAA
jgi:predicted transcriptional regulator